MECNFKNRWQLGWCFLIAVSGITSPGQTQVANGGFETGDFASWKLGLPWGASANGAGKIPVGTAQVLSTSVQLVRRASACTAREGNVFAALGTLDNGNFPGTRTANVTLSQKLSLTEHDIVSGWASFLNGDSQPEDCAWVKFVDSKGQEVATPWTARSGLLNGGDINSAPYLSATPWTYWQWAAPADGLYTVSLGVTVTGNNNFASYGFFDDICVQSTSPVVPEPSALTLWAAGALLLAGRWRCSK